VLGQHGRVGGRELLADLLHDGQLLGSRHASGSRNEKNGTPQTSGTSRCAGSPRPAGSGRSPLPRARPEVWGVFGCARRRYYTASLTGSSMRDTAGSTRMPGPIVDDTVTPFTSRPLAAAGLARSSPPR